jgi:hypothetical protein
MVTGWPSASTLKEHQNDPSASTNSSASVRDIAVFILDHWQNRDTGPVPTTRYELSKRCPARAGNNRYNHNTFFIGNAGYFYWQLNLADCLVTLWLKFLVVVSSPQQSWKWVEISDPRSTVTHGTLTHDPPDPRPTTNHTKLLPFLWPTFGPPSFFLLVDVLFVSLPYVELADGEK